MAESADINVDELRRRARRRLVGAVVLALGVAVVVPMLLETEQKPLPEDVAVKIPPIDDGKFVNRLSESRAKDGAAQPAQPPASEPPKDAASAPAASQPSAATTPPPSAAAPAAPERTSKYDTRIPDAAPGSVASVPGSAAAPNARGTSTPDARTTASEPRAATSEPRAAASEPRAAASEPRAAASEPRAADATKHAPAAHDGFAVQLAAFADDKGASALAGRLKKSGYTAYTEPLKTSKGTLWRVRVGPFPSREAAVAARDKLKAEGQSGIVAAVK